jgi:heme/copper-type cytochrome/quinol oxidase subunit 2
LLFLYFFQSFGEITVDKNLNQQYNTHILNKQEQHMNKQTGFTAIELMIVLAGVTTLAIGVFLLYAAFHFLAKFW